MNKVKFVTNVYGCMTCYRSFCMIQGTVAGMILKQTSGPVMLHQRHLVELVLA